MGRRLIRRGGGAGQIRAEIGDRWRTNGANRWGWTRTERRAKVDIDALAYAERGEKMHTRKEGAIVEEPGKAPACVSLRRRRFLVRRFDMGG
jgi:hypothetical protein